MSRFLPLVLILIASPRAHADPPAHVDPPMVRIGAMAGFQQTDRSAWDFGPSLEIHAYKEFSIRGEAQIELGDFTDPFGKSNIRGGPGPHVNNILFGPTWRPEKYAHDQLAVGVEAGVQILHSTFAMQEFTKEPAAGVFVQAGRMLGPVSFNLQLRLDMSASVAMASPDGGSVPTTTGRLNLSIELPLGP